MPQYDAKLVRGTNSAGTSERLATQADQSTIQSQIATINSTIRYAEGYNAGEGIATVGIGHTSNDAFVFDKFHQGHIEEIVVTDDRESPFLYLPSRETTTAIHKVIITGYNAEEFDLVVTLYRYGLIDDNTPFDRFVIGSAISSTTPTIYENMHDYNHPWPVADWDSNNDRWGYAIVEPLIGGSLTPSFSFNIIIYHTPWELN